MHNQNLKHIYDKLKKENGNLSDAELRQRAWMLRDRLIFEASDSIAPSTAAAAAGSGGGRIPTMSNSGSTIFYDMVDGVFQYYVYSSGGLSELKTLTGYSTNSYISSNLVITNGGYVFAIYDNDSSIYKVFYIGQGGEELYSFTSSNLNIDTLSRCIVARYDNGDGWTISVFDQGGTVRNFLFDFEAYPTNNYDPAFDGGFVVREEEYDGEYWQYRDYLIKDGSSDKVLFRTSSNDVEAVTVYQYGYSDKIVVKVYDFSNDIRYEIYDANGSMISEFITSPYTDRDLDYFIQDEITFLDSSGSFVVKGYNNDTGSYAVIFYSGTANSFSYKTIDSSYYNDYDFGNQPDYRYSREDNSEGAAVIAFYKNQDDSVDGFAYYEEVLFLPIWSTDSELRDFYVFATASDGYSKGIFTNYEDSGISLNRSADYITAIVDTDKSGGTYSILRLNKTGEIATILETSIPKDGEIVDTDAFAGKCVVQVQKIYEALGYGFGDFSNLGERSYRYFVDALDERIGNNIVGRELVMKDTANSKYWAFVFTQWSGENNGGGFAYTRQLIEGGSLSGDPIAFTHSNYGSEVDVIEPGVLELTRGYKYPIYNSAVEPASNKVNPKGTLWNSNYVEQWPETIHYMIAKDGTTITTEFTDGSNADNNDWDGNTYVLSDLQNGVTLASVKSRPEFFTSADFIYTKYNETDWYNGQPAGTLDPAFSNAVISYYNKFAILTDGGATSTIEIPFSEQNSEINRAYINKKYVFVKVYNPDADNSDFFFYTIAGKLIGSKSQVINDDIVWVEERSCVSFRYVSDSTRRIIAIDREIMTEYETVFETGISSTANNYQWWD